MNNPFDYIPDENCDKAFSRLRSMIEELKGSDRPEDRSFCRELEEGKMLGVLIAEDCNGDRHTLFAFSGQIGDSGFYHNGFVEPIFDYLQPNGYFKTKEADISHQNREIARFELETLANIRSNFTEVKEKMDAKVAEYKEFCHTSKLKREAKRASGATDAELAAMIRQSQFEKAELHRLKKLCAAEIAPIEDRLRDVEQRIEAMKVRRRNDSEALQQWLFSNFKVLNGRGESRSLSDIFAETPMKIPPSGAGECCAPKLLYAAYKNGWRPVAMAEYWYGRPKNGEVRIHGNHYPACRGKCGPVLSWMLQGVEVTPPLGDDTYNAATREPEVIFENEWFCIVDKPAGMLSVPGKGVDTSVQAWLDHKYGAERCAKPAHRLDQDTSGLLVVTFGQESYKTMQRLFATREVKKTYAAELDGDYKARGLNRRGRIELPLSADILDRPRQRVDTIGGKEATTEYEFIGSSDSRSRILLYPLTGRTHQLRVHAASSEGLGMPIIGDRLYGRRHESGNERLRLHACRIEFRFPLDRRNYCFKSPVPF